jgi:hypothetical protein
VAPAQLGPEFGRFAPFLGGAAPGRPHASSCRQRIEVGLIGKDDALVSSGGFRWSSHRLAANESASCCQMLRTLLLPRVWVPRARSSSIRQLQISGIVPGVHEQKENARSVSGSNARETAVPSGSLSEYRHGESWQDEPAAQSANPTSPQANRASGHAGT